MRDMRAWMIFCWILLSVDKTTGKMTIGRKWASDYFKMSESTFYDNIQRLKKRYKVITLTTEAVTGKFTIITVINWHLYQNGNTSGNNKVTIKQQLGNNKVTHIQEDRIENRDNIPVDKQRESLPEKISVKPKRTVNQEKYGTLIAYLEETLETKFTNYPKQSAALKKMFAAGYTDNQIRIVIRGMNASDFYRDKGFDMTTVMNEIPRFKAKMRGGKK